MQVFFKTWRLPEAVCLVSAQASRIGKSPTREPAEPPRHKKQAEYREHYQKAVHQVSYPLRKPKAPLDRCLIVLHVKNGVEIGQFPRHPYDKRGQRAFYQNQ